MEYNDNLSVGIQHNIVDRLLKIYANEDFASEVMDALEAEDEADALYEYLMKNQELVASEVFDSVEVVTSGRFHKEFCDLKKKIRLFRSGQVCVKELLDCIRDNDVIFLMRWDLTSEEEEQFKNANIGDTIHIDTQVEPILLEYGEGGFAFLIYSSEYEIPEEFRRVHTCQTSSGIRAFGIAKSLNVKLPREVAIYLDFNSDETITITPEML